MVAATTVAAGIAEVAVRLLAPQPLYDSQRFYAADPHLGWTLAPRWDGVFTNVAEFSTRVRTDALGLRVAPEQERRGPLLLGLGDSFMFGYGVEAEETFLARTAAAVGAGELNAGVPAYGVCQAVGRGLAIAGEVRPTAAVLAIFLGNDEHDDGETRPREVIDGALVSAGKRRASWGARLAHALFAGSHLVRLTRYSAPVEWAESRLTGAPSLRRALQREVLMAYEDPPPPAVVAGGEAGARCLGELAAAARAGGWPVVAVLVPSAFELTPERLEAVAASLGAADRHFDLELPRRRWRSRLAALGIPAVDPLPQLQRLAASGRRPFWSVDPHLTPAGCAAVAEALTPAVRSALAGGPGGGR